MKTRFALLMILPLVAVMISGCEKEKENPSVTLGAQANAAVPGFYSVSLDKTYTMSQAADNAGMIDIFCFYEAATGNNIALASPGSGIRDIFTGDDMPDNWGTKNTTYFFQTTLTATQFEAVQDGDALIETSFDTDNARKKAKDVQVGQVWAFRTQDGTYGLLLATAVTQGTDGTVTFRVRTK
ncbi:MAG TPA: hypothetical protein PKK03_02490 [Bacteroidales bacterium]|jgi:hypothetical protein|nr:hypothetical protein [Bacteroidales bacterium]